jgi:hypothetical protein
MQLFLIAAAVASSMATPTLAGTIYDSNTPETITVVRSDGKVLGADPDLRVRFELARDAYASEY